MSDTQEVGSLKSPSLLKAIDVDRIIVFLSVCMVLYHVVYARTMFQGPIQHQDTHLLFGLVIVYLYALKDHKKQRPLIMLLLLGGVISTVYILWFYPALQERIGFPTTSDIYIGIVLLVACFMASFYALGKVLPIVGLVFIAYTFLGQYVPGPLWHFPIALKSAISSYDIGLSGMFGVVLGASANYIFMFIVFGAILQGSGAGQFFIEIG